MSTELRYRGKNYGPEQINFIRKLVAENPTATRRALSLKLCEAWNWRQANGAPRDMVCRGLLLALHRAGKIQLPPPRTRQPIPTQHVPKADLLEGLTFTPFEGPLRQLRPLEVRQVRRSQDEPLFEALLERHHYLGYTRPVGEHLKHLIRARGEPLACLLWTSAARHIGCRDRAIGWDKQQRRSNLHLIAYNQRFLIVPWVKVKHLATHLLGLMARRLSRDWEEVYAHPIYFLETFVDPERFRGTSYRAANWLELGETTGRGKDDIKHRGPNRPVKKVFGYPLVRDFREKLCERRAT